MKKRSPLVSQATPQTRLLYSGVATICNERNELLREINRTDNEIDELVYDLYGLTEEERKIVERD
ncbi:MAG: hypothetical protein KAV98_01790 [Dehalococcoidia bacterium]|nr:hypothetical protein [Dehalococcoidia bacterium]